MAVLDCACGRKIISKPEWAGRRIRCSACGAVLAVPEDDTSEEATEPTCQHCGKPVQKGAYRCMHCKQSLQKPAAPPVPDPEPIVADPAPPQATTMRCPSCAETIQAEAIVCRFCRQPLNRGARQAEAGPRTDTGGTGALVVAIIAWVVCVLLHPVAWYMGQSYVADCEAAGVRPSGAGQAAKILGLIGTILVGVVVVLMLVVAVIGAATGL